MAPSSPATQRLSGFTQLSPLVKVIVLLPLTILMLEHVLNIAHVVSNYDQNLSQITSLDFPQELHSSSQSKPQSEGTVPQPVKEETISSKSEPQEQEAKGIDEKHQRNEGQVHNDPNELIFRDPARDIRRPLSQIVGPTPNHCEGRNTEPVPVIMTDDEASLYNSNRHIPKIIHQTSRSRCMTSKMNEVVKNWRDLGGGYNYYFHSDEAMARLLDQDWPEFPHLNQVLHCIPKFAGTVKADLWRYIVLWEYGGIYADIDTKPNKFNRTSITETDQAFFVVEQYHLLSQYFMAAAPRHPIMFYTIQSTLLKLLQLSDIGEIRAPQVTGPHALHAGFQRFMSDAGVHLPNVVPGAKPAKAGTWVGTDNYTLTVVGIGEKENEYVEREFVKRHKKTQEYKEMNMTHFTVAKEKLNLSCLRALWNARDYYKTQRRPRPT